jgi:hypothetical protein
MRPESQTLVQDITSWLAWYDYEHNNRAGVISEWYYFDEDKYYYMETYMMEGSGGDH